MLSQGCGAGAASLKSDAASLSLIGEMLLR
jgi:hypothetical protein